MSSSHEFYDAIYEKYLKYLSSSSSSSSSSSLSSSSAAAAVSSSLLSTNIGMKLTSSGPVDYRGIS